MLKTIYIRVGKKIRETKAEIRGKVAYVTVESGGFPLKLELTKWHNTRAEAEKKLRGIHAES